MTQTNFVRIVLTVALLLAGFTGGRLKPTNFLRLCVERQTSTPLCAPWLPTGLGLRGWE